MIMSLQPCDDYGGSYNAQRNDLIDLNCLHASGEHHQGEREFRPYDGGGKKYSED